MKPTCSSSTNSLTTIMDLPDDCLVFIFQCLVSGSDRESFGLTCHRCLRVQNLSRQSLQFQCSFKQLDISSLSHSNTNVTIRTFHLHRLLTRFQHLHLLSLSGCTEPPDSGLSHLVNYGITDHGLSMAATGCPLLQVISLYRCQITDFGLGNLAKRVLLSFKGSLSQGCRQLQAVKISHCKGITGVGFKGSSSTLAYVEAESCKLEPEGLLGIVSRGGIEYLIISGLIFQNCRNGLAAIGRGFAFLLKILNLRLCRTFGDESIVAIAEGCPLLQEWNLALCHEVKIVGWSSIGMSCHKLEKLHVNRCWNLCDQGLVALRNGCKQLSVLYMNGCPKITSTAIELFKCYRSEVTIKNEEKMCIGPIWELR
ncbi:F-box/LRR-repeat protein 12 [Pyrus ussuriensis x Pyrus communis]|uniref:F-box/LRR-repeat protein 12 n=1 Tax=Pyrus ussuriensis x Pyrus communis TaxID=2448454 RepID=A0A5N5FHH7_9ROSA|nr:F-box/LRR-repeat protein 12 [Pyrus ussuriensis x Pyrus communis]